MRRTNGTGGPQFSDSIVVTNLLTILNTGFAVHKIKFFSIFSESINYDSLYNVDMGNGYSNFNWSNTGKLLHPQINNHSNAIDLYLFSNGNTSFVRYLGSSAAVLSGYDSTGTHYGLTNVLCHEMGHCLGLLHTFNATNKCSSTSGWQSCPELVNGSNSTTCGDYVDDTPADATRAYQADTCLEGGFDLYACSPPTDLNGQYFIKTNNNVMDYLEPNCMNTFTNGQGRRMRYFLSNWKNLWDVMEKNIDNSVITLSASPTSICSGASSLLTATSNKSFSYFYTWDYNTFYDTIPNSQLVYPQFTKTYTLSMLKDGCTQPSSSNVTITVNDNLTLPQISGDTSLCINNNYTFTIAATGGNWLVLDTAIATINSSGLLIPKQSGTTQVMYSVVTSTNNCTVASVKQIYIVPTNPYINIISDSIFCLGTPKFIEAQASSGLYNFIWNTLDTGKIISKRFLTTGNQNLSVTASSPCGTAITSAIKVVNVLPLPHVEPITSNLPASGFACLFKPYQFSCTTNTLANNPWSTNDLNEDYIHIDSSNGNFYLKNYNSYDIYYHVIDSNFCEDYSQLQLNLIEPYININGNNTLCKGAVTTYTANISGGTWYSSNTAIADVNVNTGEVIGKSTGSCFIEYKYVLCNDTIIGTKMINITGTLPQITNSTNFLTTCSPAFTFSANINGTWSSTNTAVATINATSGVLTVVSTGNTTIIFTPTSNICNTSAIPNTLEIIDCIADRCDTSGFTPITKLASGVIPHNSSFVNDFYTVNNDIFIIGDVLFENIKLKISKGTSIIVESGATLQINGCHLFSCDSMWKGIKLKDHNSRIIVDGFSTNASLIEDADTAISLIGNDTTIYANNNNIVSINNTIFNRNKIGIYLSHIPPNSNSKIPVSIANTIFTCREIPYSSAVLSWPNINSFKTTIHTQGLLPLGTPNTYYSPYINSSFYPDNTELSFLKDSTGSNKSYAGIIVKYTGSKESNNFISFKIGDAISGYGSGFSENTNIFDNQIIGIEAINSNVMVGNCIFQKPALHNGIGINVINTPPLLSQFMVLPDPNNPIPPNTNYPFIGRTEIITQPGMANNAFFDMGTAIHISGAKSVIVKDCDIRSSGDTSTANAKGNYGIVIGSYYYTNIDIDNNHIHNTKNAVWFSYGVDRSPFDYGIPNPYPGKLSVKKNKITDAVAALQTGNEYLKNAIIVDAVLYGSNDSSLIVCDENEINGAVNGIKLSGVNGAVIKNNDINLIADRATIKVAEQYGICLEPDWLGYGGGSAVTGHKTIVEENRVTGYDYYAPIPSSGILLNQKAETEIGCNIVNNLTHGFKFVGYNPNTKFWDNTMPITNKYGFTLEQQGIIGRQGNWNSAMGIICPSNNSWEQPVAVWQQTISTAFPQYMTNTINSVPSQSQLVVLNSTTNPQINPNGSGYADLTGFEFYHISGDTTSPIFYANGNNNSCVRCASANTDLKRSTEDLTLLEQIADGTILLYNQEPEDRLLVMQEQLYELLHNNADILANSSSLQQFISDNQWNSLDFIYYAGKYLAEGNMEMLQVLLGFWPKQEGLDETYYQYFEWMMAKYNDPDFNPDESIVLEYANRCPLTYGTVVYAYRNLYNAITNKIHEFENNCEGYAARGSNKPQFIRLKQPKQIPIVQQTEKKKLLIYPNPAVNNITIKFPNIKQILVYDIHGRIVKNIATSKTSNTQINISGLHKGIYMIKVISTDNIVETQKLIVQ
ncbi:MAG: T9SS type A sorting domain-containing protein [Chitinophagaceae bacterium]